MKTSRLKLTGSGLMLAAGPLFLLVLMPFHKFVPLPHLRQHPTV